MEEYIVIDSTSEHPSPQKPTLPERANNWTKESLSTLS